MSLTWSLELGCLAEFQRVIFDARSAARLVETIVHVRVVARAGPLRISVHPDCAGQVFQEYSVQVLGSAPGRGGTRLGRRQVFMEERSARLEPGQEYLVLL